MNLKQLTDSMLNRFIAFVLVYILFGVVVFRWLEGFGWIDSLYYVVVTLATVGYGDLAPQTQAGRLVAVFYIVFGIVIFLLFAKVILLRLGSRRKARKGGK